MQLTPNYGYKGFVGYCIRLQVEAKEVQSTKAFSMQKIKFYEITLQLHSYFPHVA